jgi:glucokinase
MSATNDPRAVMTLDAGGTNFVFSAMRANQTVVAPFTLPANADNLERRSPASPRDSAA